VAVVIIPSNARRSLGLNPRSRGGERNAFNQEDREKSGLFSELSCPVLSCAELPRTHVPCPKLSFALMPRPGMTRNLVFRTGGAPPGPRLCTMRSTAVENTLTRLNWKSECRKQKIFSPFLSKISLMRDQDFSTHKRSREDP
jgi:hypothetical protein